MNIDHHRQDDETSLEVVADRVVHRRYVPHSAAHYGGGLVDGAYAVALFGDVATELCVRNDGDEGLLAGYQNVRFLEPVHVGDVIEISGVIRKFGKRSREIDFTATVTCRASPDQSPSAAHELAEPVIAVVATGTVVVPVAQRFSQEALK
jgi:3-aminobutyryl-CoA ammonia-lyase